MKERMKERKDRKKSKRAVEELEAQLKNVEPGSPEEAQIREALQQRDDADGLRGMDAVLAVLTEVDNEQQDEKGRQVRLSVLPQPPGTELRWHSM